MNINEGMEQLSQMFKTRDWFYDVGQDPYGRIVVYVKYMCQETLHEIPDKAGGIQVLVHFSGSKTATREQFVDTPNAPGSTLKPFDPKAFIEAAKVAQANGIDTGFGSMLDDGDLDQIVGHEEEEKSVLHLQKELDRLEKSCGSRTLQDIFYEVQDGKNAVTNMSARYPEVRQTMEKLYDEYGFDVIYEELDG